LRAHGAGDRQADVRTQDDRYPSRKTFVRLAVITAVASAVLGHVLYVNHARPWFSATFSTGEQIRIVWYPRLQLWQRMLGHGKLVCAVADAQPFDLVYGEYNAYGRKKFTVRESAYPDYDDNDDEHLIPFIAITESVQQSEWVVDNKGRFLGSN